MADVPSQVNYGQVTGHFVQFIADTSDPGNVPDEIPLAGTVTLTPLSPTIRFPSTSPARLAVAQAVSCIVYGGDLYPPGTDTSGPPGSLPAPGVWVMATDQPSGQPTTCQWQATFNFTGIVAQPSPVIFNVPTSGTVDLSVIAPVSQDPAIVTVVSHADALAAASSATAAQSSATAASTSASNASTSATNAASSASAASTSATNAANSASAAQTSANVLAQGKGVLVLSAAAAIPGGTPAGTVILRTAT